jgi:hypothetical protein
MPVDCIEAPKASSSSLGIGSFWSLHVDRSTPSIDSTIGGISSAVEVPLSSPHLDRAFDSKAVDSADWRTTQGLGLYVLSTLLLSVQAASAKLLGQ